MKPKPFEKADLQNNVGMSFFLATSRDVYEGEILDVNDEFVSIEYFNGVKDEKREMDIPLKDILWVKEDI